jgi:NADH-quinone oxidoreductase subunit H
MLAAPALWKTLATFLGFAVKTGFFLILYIWMRWTLPRFRYDQVMSLGWKVMLPTSLAYVMLVALTILVLDEVGVMYGFAYGAVLTAVSGAATLAFMFFLDRGRTIAGAAARTAQKVELKTIPQAVAAIEASSADPAPAGD